MSNRWEPTISTNSLPYINDSVVEITMEGHSHCSYTYMSSDSTPPPPLLSHTVSFSKHKGKRVTGVCFLFILISPSCAHANAQRPECICTRPGAPRRSSRLADQRRRSRRLLFPHAALTFHSHKHTESVLETKPLGNRSTRRPTDLNPAFTQNHEARKANVCKLG